jgi:hypothetical protein
VWVVSIIVNLGTDIERPKVAERGPTKTGWSDLSTTAMRVAPNHRSVVFFAAT